MIAEGRASWFDVPRHHDPTAGLEGVDVRFGRSRITELGTYLDDRGLHRAMVVCGPNVARNTPIMDAVRDGLGHRLVGIFGGTSPGKNIGTVFDTIDHATQCGADVLVGVGGGSSMDTARQASLYRTDGRTVDELRDEARSGRVQPPRPKPDSLPVVLIPTTLAGADLSSKGSIEILAPSESANGQPVRTAGSISPLLVLYDTDLYAMTPASVIRNSAMNGFDKGIESLYSPLATPVTDAWSVHGLRLMAQGLPALGSADPDDLHDAVAGCVLIQLRRFTSIIHAFGHGLARHSDIQQGVGHAVLAPHVLRYVLSKETARRGLLASALEVGDAGGSEEVAAAIVDAVVKVRDSLAVPAAWRDVGGAQDLDFTAIAEHIVEDGRMTHSPVPISAPEARRVLEAAW